MDAPGVVATLFLRAYAAPPPPSPPLPPAKSPGDDPLAEPGAPAPIASILSRRVQSLGTVQDDPDVNVITLFAEKVCPLVPISPTNKTVLTTDGAVGERTILPCNAV